ncbi:CCA tRNA nucleotidyltransferase [Bacillus massiliglaciei]|uniref:CCA tRNA nucleotidyltransferase n=1 Tax=Bacillus massiliglaciei TaxID=1816693 RepID=UPI000ABD3482|nr:CCA tRNA nucleotidyltransferase [Bacillus massiliglaciei]
MDDLFRKAVPVLDKLEKAGYEAYFVGGCVRDHLIGRPIHDVDIASSATPEEVKSLFPKTVDVGIEHGTIMVLEEGSSYEVTTFRTETGYSDFRRPDAVTFVRSLEEDLKRRDFSMNSIAMDKQGKLIDPYNGRQDIESRIIKTVGNPEDRFREDALRMMRAIRFVSQLGFRVDDKAFHSLQTHGALLQNIAMERIFSEFEKIVAGPFKAAALRMLLESNIHEYLPGFRDQRDNIAQLLEYPLEQLNSDEVWALLLFHIESETEEHLLRAWKMPVKKMKKIKKICRLALKTPFFAGNELELFSAGRTAAVEAGKVWACLHNEDPVMGEDVGKAYDRLVIKDKKELDVTGNDLLQWSGKNGGPWVKDSLDQALSAVLTQKVHNNKTEIREWLRQCNLI